MFNAIQRLCCLASFLALNCYFSCFAQYIFFHFSFSSTGCFSSQGLRMNYQYRVCTHIFFVLFNFISFLVGSRPFLSYMIVLLEIYNLIKVSCKLICMQHVLIAWSCYSFNILLFTG